MGALWLNDSSRTTSAGTCKASPNVIRATASRAGTANASQSGNRLAALMRKSLTAIGITGRGFFSFVGWIWPSAPLSAAAQKGLAAHTMRGRRASFSRDKSPSR